MRRRRGGKRFLSISPYLILISLSTGFVIKTIKGEISASKVYDDIRNQVTNDETDHLIDLDSISFDIEFTIDGIDKEIVPESTDSDVAVEPEIIAPVEEIPEEIPEVIPEVISDELLQSGYEFKEIDFSTLKDINNDTCGWITIDGSHIDYPMVHAGNEGNNFYLHHDIEKNDSAYGTIFVDERCNLLENKTEDLSDVTLVYGHHNKGSKMFADLCNYMEQSYYDNHPFGVIYTPDGYAYKANFFGGIITSGVDDRYIYRRELDDEQKYNEFIDYIIENSSFTSDVNIEYGDKIIGFVTCEYTQGQNSRYVLFAKLEKQYTNELQKSESTDKSLSLVR